MPHFPKPFFRKSRRAWYVQINGRQHNLGRDRQEAFRQYYDLMRQPQDRPIAADTVALGCRVRTILQHAARWPV